MTKVKFLCYEAMSKEGKKMSNELAYSIHLGSDKNKPAKSKVFTKESLTQIQDKMRESCIKSYNKVY